MSSTETKVSDKRRRPERKVEILQAVIALLEEGTGRVSTAALAERVGISEAALYRHFRNKEAIFQALVDYIEDHLLQPANQLLGRNEAVLVQLCRLFEYHLRFFADHPGLCRIFLVEGLNAEGVEVSERMGSAIHKYQAQIKQLLRRGQLLGEVPEDLPVEVAAGHFVGIIQSRTLTYAISGFKLSPLSGWQTVWLFYLRSIQAVVESP